MLAVSLPILAYKHLDLTPDLLSYDLSVDVQKMPMCIVTDFYLGIARSVLIERLIVWYRRTGKD